MLIFLMNTIKALLALDHLCKALPTNMFSSGEKKKATSQVNLDYVSLLPIFSVSMKQ